MSAFASAAAPLSRFFFGAAVVRAFRLRRLRRDRIVVGHAATLCPAVGASVSPSCECAYRTMAKPPVHGVCPVAPRMICRAPMPSM